jgi:hypothetical protein
MAIQTIYPNGEQHQGGDQRNGCKVEHWICHIGAVLVLRGAGIAYPFRRPAEGRWRVFGVGAVLAAAADFDSPASPAGRFLSLAPGPSPFSAMKTTPAATSACSMAASVLDRVSSNGPSIRSRRLIVSTETPALSASTD